MASSQYLNQIFYQCNKFDCAEKIQDLESYMYSPAKISPTLEIKTVEIPIEPVKNVANTRITPTKPDTLFWCIYIANHEYSEYQLISKQYHNKELEEKQRIMEFIRKHPETLKQSNVKMTKVRIQQTMSELMVDKLTSLMTFVAMTVYYKINVFLISRNTFLEFTCTDEEDRIYYGFHRDDRGKYTIDTTPMSSEDVIQLYKTKIALEHNPEKPLKSVSHYKMEDLLELASKLEVTVAPKMKKAELYATLLEQCIWK